ncbi:hypothetical protein C6P45_004769 [Maudiozyma exigua]|uniref:AB hydrolase-1 domain-containing protein n=1 Tax=Maudiozyma exigua TaxID=34358 RepID=A0A9P7BC85_MAUEX|nr:hypothetical protein C6P45_004769 [Kazachstania exigua]
MQTIIENNYKKETKITAAVPSRTKGATLIHEVDTLQLVYDLYTYTGDKVVATTPLHSINFLFLHGSGMNRAVWEYYVAYILEIMKQKNVHWKINKIITMDQVTHGDSAELNRHKLGTNFDWADGARDACKVAQEEFLPTSDTNCYNVVVGHSMGGFQSLACNVLCPDLFNLSILIEPVVYVPHVQNKDNVTIIPPRFYNALWSKMTDNFKNMEEFETFMKNDSFYKKSNSEILQRMIQFEAIHTMEGTIKTKISQEQNMLCYLTLDPTARWLIGSLPYIKIPVHGIVGGISTWCPPQNQELLVSRIPLYEKDVIPDGDHLVNLEDPGTCLNRIVERITEFIDSSKVGESESKKGFVSDAQREKLFKVNFSKFKEERVKDGPIILAKL